MAEDHLIATILEQDDELVLTARDAATYRHLVLAALDALTTAVKQRERLQQQVLDQHQQIARLMGLADDATRL